MGINTCGHVSCETWIVLFLIGLYMLLWGLLFFSFVAICHFCLLIIFWFILFSYHCKYIYEHLIKLIRLLKALFNKIN